MKFCVLNCEDGHDKAESQPNLTKGHLRDTDVDTQLLAPSISDSTIRGPTSATNVSAIARRGQTFSKRQTRRLVHKDGSCNISHRNVTKRRRKYLFDIFTTVIDMKWRYNFLLFAGVFVASWLAFALVWWVLLLVHSDHRHVDDDSWTPCVAHVYDFTTALLFSMETQTTIGYGYRYMEPECTIAVVIVMTQSCVGVLIQSLITGVVFAKLSRPKGRAQTILFSKSAVICRRDGQYYLIFRVADMRRSHLVGTSLRMIMVRNRITSEGECIPLCQYPLTVQTETSDVDNFMFLVWPATVTHKIDSYSPLWDISAEQLLLERFEIIVILEGTVESNGKLTQVRTSYLPSEILWGHCLAPLMTYETGRGQYNIDYTQFHNTIPINVPEYSAKEASEQNVVIKGLKEDYHPNFTLPRVTQENSTKGRWKKVKGKAGRSDSDR